MVARKALLGGVTAAPDRLQSRTFTVLVELTNMTPRMPEGRLDGHAGATASPGLAPVTVKDWSGAQALLEMLEKVSVA
jgi:pyruvate-formate lyase